MATWEDIRAAARPLPGAAEVDWNGAPNWQVGSKGFVQSYKGRVLMKLEKNHQELLFEARPEVFTPFTAGTMRWSWVEIDELDADEVGELVREAWTQVVPKKVSLPYLTAHPRAGGTQAEAEAAEKPHGSPPSRG